MSNTDITTYTEINWDQLDSAIAAYPPDVPAFMFNLLRFHETAHYGDSSYTACSGQEAYLTRYIPAFNNVVGPLGGSEMVYGGAVLAGIVGEADQPWHAVGLVRYPRLQTFYDVTQNAEYLATAEPHRKAALADWRLYLSAPLAP
jgi:uncharacterized protein (DUF1330 family)